QEFTSRCPAQPIECNGLLAAGAVYRPQRDMGSIFAGGLLGHEGRACPMGLQVRRGTRPGFAPLLYVPRPVHRPRAPTAVVLDAVTSLAGPSACESGPTRPYRR